MLELTQDKNIKAHLTVRRYQSGDESLILGTFRKVFQRDRSLEFWKWRFGENPFSSPVLGLAQSENEIVAHYGTIPVPLNVAGGKVMAAQSVDTIVVEKFRKEGLFQKTADECYAECREKKIAAVFGFPNAAAFPGRIKRLEWKRIGFMDHYVIKLSRRRSFERILKNPSLSLRLDSLRRKVLGRIYRLKAKALERNLGQGKLAEYDKVPPHYSKFWDQIKNQEALSLWKDETYFKWRYDANPVNKFKYFVYEERNEIQTLVVVQLSGATAHICECLSFGKNVTQARWVLLKILGRIVETHETVYFRGMDSGFFKNAFCDFRWRVGETDVFCGRSFAMDPTLDKMFNQRECWTVTLGDSDEV